MRLEKNIAFFSMEIGLKRQIPTYSGGLGILAGDTIKAAADLGIPLVSVSLMYRKGNFRQWLENDGWQTTPERDVEWFPEQHMKKLDLEISVPIEGREVKLDVWQYDAKGKRGIVPVYFLDANNHNNPNDIKETTSHVYGGSHPHDKLTRIRQEAILGIGGIRLLEKLGIDVSKYHLNEGHPSFLIFELMNKGMNLEEIAEKCVFTNHTLVDAGADIFDYHMAWNVLRDLMPGNISDIAGKENLNMNQLAMNCSGYANAVSKRHAEMFTKIFNREIDSITNGVHSETWTSESFQELYDKYCEGWRENSELLINARDIPLDEIWQAHTAEKKRMLNSVNFIAGVDMEPEVLTIGFARRVAKYKRANLIFNDLQELARMGNGKLQLIFSGKAHPHDEPAKYYLKEIFNSIRQLQGKVKCVYLQGYNMDFAKSLVSGCDVWLNTPLAPLEACGTSGMKASHNAVPHFSTLDGWWYEACQDNINGWGIGKANNNIIGTDSYEAMELKREDAKSLYEKLENVIMPEYYSRNNRFREIMRNAISTIASHYNAHRMIKEYSEKAYKQKERILVSKSA